jgi:hypothetical protein
LQEYEDFVKKLETPLKEYKNTHTESEAQEGIPYIEVIEEDKILSQVIRSLQGIPITEIILFHFLQHKLS